MNSEMVVARIKRIQARLPSPQPPAFVSAMRELLSSISYTAPEIIHLRWYKFCTLVQAYYPPVKPLTSWQQEIVRIIKQPWVA